MHIFFTYHIFLQSCSSNEVTSVNNNKDIRPSDDCGEITANFDLVGANTICEGDSVRIIGSSSPDADYYIVNWGDGNRDTTKSSNISHIYNSELTQYVICFIAVKNCANGRRSSHYNCSPIFVTPLPVAEFDFNTDACIGEEITFFNRSQYLTSLIWEFGDGGKSVERNPTYIYKTPGIKQIRLSAINDCGISMINHAIEICGEDKTPTEEEYIFTSKPFSLNPTPMKRIELKREKSKSPKIKCPEYFFVHNEPGKCEAYITHPKSPGAISYHRNGKVETSGIYPIGISTALMVLPDGTICSNQFEVVDNEAPALICPNDVIVKTSPFSSNAIANWNLPILKDNCPGSRIIKSTHNPNNRFPVGVTKVTYTAIDASGNESTCNFNVRVKR